MFTLGIILLAAGALLRLWLRLVSRREARTLQPLPMSQRTHTLQNLKRSRRFGFYDANLMLAAGIVLVLITAVFN